MQLDYCTPERCYLIPLYYTIMGKTWKRQTLTRSFFFDVCFEVNKGSEDGKNYPVKQFLLEMAWLYNIIITINSIHLELHAMLRLAFDCLVDIDTIRQIFWIVLNF